jgi:hypothetical protein
MMIDTGKNNGSLHNNFEERKQPIRQEREKEKRVREEKMISLKKNSMKFMKLEKKEMS